MAQENDEKFVSCGEIVNFSKRLEKMSAELTRLRTENNLLKRGINTDNPSEAEMAEILKQALADAQDLVHITSIDIECSMFREELVYSAKIYARDNSYFVGQRYSKFIDLVGAIGEKAKEISPKKRFSS